ncbi:MAG: hypothetical protein ACPGUE_11130 [Marinomonas sp.]
MLLTVEQIKELSDHVDDGLTLFSAEEVYGINRGSLAKYLNAYRNNDLNSVMNNTDRLLLIKDEIVDMTRKEIFELFKERFGVKLHRSTFTYAAKRAGVEYLAKERTVLTEENKLKAAKVLKSGQFFSFPKLAKDCDCSEFQIRQFAKSLGITKTIPMRDMAAKLLKESHDYMSTDEVALKLNVKRAQAANAIQSIRTFNVAIVDSIKIGRTSYYKIK